MDIKKPQLVKVEAFADFFQSGIPGHIQGGSLEKMRVLQHPRLLFVGNPGSDIPESSATPPATFRGGKIIYRNFATPYCLHKRGPP